MHTTTFVSVKELKRYFILFPSLKILIWDGEFSFLILCFIAKVGIVYDAVAWFQLVLIIFKGLAS